MVRRHCTTGSLILSNNINRCYLICRREVALLALSADPPEYPLDPPVKPPRLVYPASYFAAKQNIHPLGPTACTLSHILAYKTAIAAGDRSFLLLEDDVDIDFGIESLWQSMSEAMEVREQGWDIVYLGWSWSSERACEPPSSLRRMPKADPSCLCPVRPKFHPLLRPSNSPSGLHGVAFSWRGVRRVHDFLTTSPVLFSRPIDHEYVPLVVIPERASRLVPARPATLACHEPDRACR